MPKAFDRCYKKGGKIRTEKMSKKRYRHICILEGKTYLGEVKTLKTKK